MKTENTIDGLQSHGEGDDSLFPSKIDLDLCSHVPTVFTSLKHVCLLNLHSQSTSSVKENL